MLDSNTAAELQNDLRQSDADLVLDEIERELTLEAEAMLLDSASMDEIFKELGPDVVPIITQLFRGKVSLTETDAALNKMYAHFLDLAKNMKREEVTQRVMEERESIEYGYEG